MKINSPQFNLMYKACNKASKVLIRDFGEVEKLQVSEKGPGDFVTASDKRVEKIIIGELEKSDYSILSEEVGLIEGKNKDKKWIIDPIDGTFNFLNGLPHFAISIASSFLIRSIRVTTLIDGKVSSPKCSTIFKANNLSSNTSTYSPFRETFLLLLKRSIICINGDRLCL